MRKKFKQKSLSPALADVHSDLPPTVGVERFCDLFGISDRTFRDWKAKGKVRAIKTAPGGSGRVLVLRAEVLRLLAVMAE